LFFPSPGEQLQYAGEKAIVIEISFYHSRDAIYRLENMPGLWNEACLSLDADYTAK
jgi:hypothetical protein